MASLFDACSAQPLEAYNIEFHVVGLLIVLVTSATGVSVAMLFSTWAATLQSFKMFGIGVIAATAWVHLLPDAFDKFSNPCLDAGWAKYGTSYVGLFAMIAAFIIQLVEIMASGRVGPNKCVEVCDSVQCHTTIIEIDTPDKAGSIHHKLHNHDDRSHSHSHNIPPGSSMTRSDTLACINTDTEAHEKGKKVSVMVLECGILIHSIVIGLSLGTTPDEKFTPLLVAIVFHQTFEGMALGALLTTLNISKQSKILLSMLYPITTPLAMAVGIAVRETFNENTQQLILVQGIFNSLSTGILIYATYCELMSGKYDVSNYS